MKKIVLLMSLSLIGLSSCTLPWSSTPEDVPVVHNLTTDYQRHIGALFGEFRSVIASYYEFAELISPSGYDDSTIRIAGRIPETGSGEISIRANAVRETRANAMSADFDIHGFIDTDGTLARIDQLTGGFVYGLGEYYLRVDQAKLSGSGSDFSRIEKNWNETFASLKPYFGKWLSLKLRDMPNLQQLEPTHTKKQTNISNDAIFGIAGFELDLLSGGKKLEKVLLEHPPIRAIDSLGKSGDMYRYSIELDQAGSIALVESLMQTYAGTGLTQSGMMDIQRTLSGVTLTGVLSIHESMPEYFTFSGTLSQIGERDAFALDIAILQNESHIIVRNPQDIKKSIVYRSHTQGNTTDREFSVEGNKILSLSTEMDKNTLRKLDANIIAGSTQSGAHVIYTFDQQQRFYLGVSAPQQVEIQIDGALRGSTLASLSGSIIPQDESPLTIQYAYTTDGGVTGKITNSQLPGDITLDGHVRVGDILLNASLAGMTTTLTHSQKSANFEGSLRFPVGTLSWSGKETRDFFETLSLSLISPAVSLGLDMQTVDGWLTGPLRIRSTEATGYIPEVDIRARRSGQDFSLRTDMTLSSDATDRAHFEWDSHIDIRHDRAAHVVIPAETVSFVTVFSGGTTH